MMSDAIETAERSQDPSASYSYALCRRIVQPPPAQRLPSTALHKSKTASSEQRQLKAMPHPTYLLQVKQKVGLQTKVALGCMRLRFPLWPQFVIGLAHSGPAKPSRCSSAEIFKSLLSALDKNAGPGHLGNISKSGQSEQNWGLTAASCLLDR